MSYRLTVGLETHIELSTKTKMFCGCKTEFGAKPNSQCCEVCLGLPGSLPVMNKKVVESAIKAGIATGCTINKLSKMDRKNYFYPDLAKAYQITQYYMPICEGGHINLGEKAVRINRIHMEEDAGKLIYKDDLMLIDYNRSGIPLIEVVTEPDINSAEEAGDYMEKLVNIMRHIGISDCKMEEGSVRCDVNVSVSDSLNHLGTKVEIKNINSIKFLKRAIEFEKERQIEILSSGGTIEKETRKFDDKMGTTKSMRKKEDATDYRYFADPDLPPINLSGEWIENIKKSMPMEFEERLRTYVKEYGIPASQAKTLLKYKNVWTFFESATKKMQNKKIVANLILGKIFKTLKTEDEKRAFNIKVKPSDLQQFSQLIEKGKLLPNMANAKLEHMLKTGKIDLSVETMSDEEIINLAKQAILEKDEAVRDYRQGKSEAVETLIGEAMKKSTGRANPLKIRKIIEKLLNE